MRIAQIKLNVHSILSEKSHIFKVPFLLQEHALLVMFCKRLWSWRGLNPRPNRDVLCFLHAYLRLVFSGNVQT